MLLMLYVLVLGVIFVPCDNKQPVRYLLTLNRHDTVKQLRSQLVAALDDDDSCDLIITEAFDNHIARVLVSLTTLCLIDFRVTTCLENLEMSGNLEHVREMSGMLLTVREMSGKKSCPKTVHY